MFMNISPRDKKSYIRQHFRNIFIKIKRDSNFYLNCVSSRLSERQTIIFQRKYSSIYFKDHHHHFKIICLRNICKKNRRLWLILEKYDYKKCTRSHRARKLQFCRKGSLWQGPMENKKWIFKENIFEDQ